ncbi:MAG: sulfite exporter TauE/SafE family protein [Verrucomicrobiota bacterium]
MTLSSHSALSLLTLFLAGLYAGTQNVLAGGGSFITFPTLLLSGLNPLSANITSTVSLFPSQIVSAFHGKKLTGDVHTVKLRTLFLLSIFGGILGGLLLLNTPVSIFSKLVPWLVLFATLVFIWGSFRKKNPHGHSHLSPRTICITQFLIGVYGGYFGGGIGILMLAALTMAGVSVRMATANKNWLAMSMNASAVLLFVFSNQVDWIAAASLTLGGIGGGFLGGWLLHRLPEKILKCFVILIGIVLTTWLFLKP